MKSLTIAALILPLAACSTEREVSRTTIVASVTGDQQRACRNAAANARNMEGEDVVITGATATTTGPSLDLNVGGAAATCKIDMLGEVEGVSFGQPPSTEG